MTMKHQRSSDKDIEVTKGLPLAEARKELTARAAQLTANGCGSTHYVYIAPLGPGSDNFTVYVRVRAHDNVKKGRKDSFDVS